MLKDACAGATLSACTLPFIHTPGEGGARECGTAEPPSAARVVSVLVGNGEAAHEFGGANVGMGGQGTCVRVCAYPLIHLRAGASLGARVRVVCPIEDVSSLEEGRRGPMMGRGPWASQELLLFLY